MELDLLERCRAGDRAAYRALVAFWGDGALQAAARVAGDRARAQDAVRAGFQEAWRELPSLHSERAFRPWLLGKIAEAARERGGTPLPNVGGLQLPAWFFDEAIAPGLKDSPVLEARREVAAAPSVAWAVLRDPGSLPVWTSVSRLRVSASSHLREAARATGRGRIADRRVSRDETLFTRVEDPSLLAWTTRARPVGLPGAIELRWSVEILPARDGCELRHRLHAVAFPAGVAGRVLRRSYGRLSERMQGSMHRGLERLAAMVEARARVG